MANRFRMKWLVLGVSGVVLTGCAGLGVAGGGSENDVPAMRWDFRPEATDWTNATLNAIDTFAPELVAMVPADIKTFCPAYETASDADRRAFWAGILSALAKHESTWNPNASGGGGAWLGLLQIAPGTARAYRCDIDDRSDLFDGEKNLECGVKIMAKQVAQGGVVASYGSPWLGLSADWAPFRSARKFEDMASWTRAQSYCAI